MEAKNRIEELMKDEEFFVQLLEVSTAEELKALFDSRNITLEEGLTYENALKIVQEKKTGELDENDLDAVAGGSITLATAIGAGIVLCVSANLVAFFVGYGVQTVKNMKKKK